MTREAAANVWMVGGGIASMAAAAFLIRDAGVPGENIHILEELVVPDGSLDGARSPAQDGYVTRGGRMFEDEAYRCLWNMLDTIPDRDDPGRSAREVITAFNQQVKTQARARLISPGHEILDAAAYGLSGRDRAELTRLLAVPEHALGPAGSTRCSPGTSSGPTSGRCGARRSPSRTGTARSSCAATSSGSSRSSPASTRCRECAGPSATSTTRSWSRS